MKPQFKTLTVKEMISLLNKLVAQGTISNDMKVYLASDDECNNIRPFGILGNTLSVDIDNDKLILI